MDDNLKFKEKILENAIKHKGDANVKFIFGAILKDFPEWRSKISELKEVLSPIVDEINKLSLDEQKEELKKINPDFFNQEKEERNIFAFLKIKEGDEVVSAFPPSPEKHYHIGHAKAILLNYLLAKQYNGKFHLRFEDTNPKNVKPEFYQVMQDDISWLGVKWDKLIYASDHIQTLIDFAEKLITKNQAYVCYCTPEEMSENRNKKHSCECRNKSPQENLIEWEKMKKDMEEGKASLRLKIDMSHKNARMRDPTIFRIIDAEHPRHGYKFRVFPTYDFQNSVLDGYFGVTHRLRTVEFEMASELHHYIRKLLGLYDTTTYEFSRLNLEGMLSSGRVIREKVESGELIGWDDPSLPTLASLRRRGFSPKAMEDMLVETGITKSAGSTLTWDSLIKCNKRVLNDTSKRFFLIKDPIEITINNDPKQNYSLSVHPNLDLGKRDFVSNGTYLIEKEDFDSFKEGQLIRLMDNLNFRFKDLDNLEFESIDYMDFKKEENSNKKIIHFLPKDDSQLVDVTVFTPEHELIKTKAEKHISQLEVGEVIQFERFGFCRLDSIEEVNGNKVYNFWFTH